MEVSEVKNLQERKNVRWDVEVTAASPKSAKSLEKADRSQKKRKTLHTWRLRPRTHHLEGLIESYRSLPMSCKNYLCHTCRRLFRSVFFQFGVDVPCFFACFFTF